MDNLAKFLGVNRSEMQHVFDLGQWTPVSIAKSSLHKNNTGLHLSNNKRTIPNYIRLNSSGELSSDEDCEVVCSNQNNQGIQAPICSFTEAEFNGMGRFPEHDIRNMSSLRPEAHNVQGEGPRRSDPRTCTLPFHITNNNMAHNQRQSRMFSKSGTLDNGYTINNRHAGPWESFTAQQGHTTGFGKPSDDGVYFNSPLYCGPNPSQSWQLRTASQWQGLYPHTHQLAPQQTHFMQVNSVPACRRVQMASGQSGPVYYNMPVYNIVAGMMPVWFGTAWGPNPCVLQQPQQPPCPAPSGGQNTYNQTFMRPRRKYAKPCSKFPRKSPCKDTTVDLQTTPIHQTRPVVQHIEKADSPLPPSNSEERSKLHCPDHSEKVSISSCEVEKLANDLDLLVMSNPPSSDCGKADLENDPKPELCDNVQSVISEATAQRQQEITEKDAIVNLKMDILTADDEGISLSAGNSCALSQSENTMNPSKDSKSQGSGEPPKQGGAACLARPCRIILSSLPNFVHRKKKKSRPSAEKRRRRKVKTGEQAVAVYSKVPQGSNSGRNKKAKTGQDSSTTNLQTPLPSVKDKSVKKTPCQMSNSVAFILGLDLSGDSIEDSDLDADFTPIGLKTACSFVVGASDSDFDESDYDSLDGFGGPFDANCSGIWEGLGTISDPYNPLNFHVRCSIQSSPIKKSSSAPSLSKVATDENEADDRPREVNCPEDLQSFTPRKQVKIVVNVPLGNSRFIVKYVDFTRG